VGTTATFTLRKNAKRAAEAMIRKGTAPAIDYRIKQSDDGRFEIVWKTARTAPTIGEVETEIADVSADQPAASEAEPAPQLGPAATEPATTNAAPQPASEAEAASQSAPAAAEPGPAMNEPASTNEWPQGTRVMVRKRRLWREATVVTRLDPDHWRAEYPGGGSKIEIADPLARDQLQRRTGLEALQTDEGPVYKCHRQQRAHAHRVVEGMTPSVRSPRAYRFCATWARAAARSARCRRGTPFGRPVIGRSSAPRCAPRGRRPHRRVPVTPSASHSGLSHRSGSCAEACRGF
jgi:hypothetical protein